MTEIQTPESVPAAVEPASLSVEQTAKVVCGVDGCRGGWIVVRHDLATGDTHWEVVPTLRDLVEMEPMPACIAVDVPIGLLDEGTRMCDSEARRRLPGRTSSGFTAPIRPVLEAETYELANAAGRAADGKGISVQAWAIVPKVREADQVLRADEGLRQIVREVHPEVCFAAMNGGRPMASNKKSPEGREERVALLRRAFGDAVDAALASRPAGCAADDILDAMACAWTAARVARGEGECIPADPPCDRYGLRMEMVI